MLNLVVFGGGRWSRVILTVLQRIVPDAKISWITQHNFSDCRQFLSFNNLQNVSLLTSDQDLDSNPDGVIIATAPSQHYNSIKNVFRYQVPVLAEKPLTLNFSEANALVESAESQMIPLGINHEFLYPSYLQDLKKIVSGLKIESAEIIWTDPHVESRYGEIKTGDFHTEVIFDYFAHAWSLLLAVFPDDPVLEIGNVELHPNLSVSFEGRHKGMTSRFHFTRRGEIRERKIIVNSGEVALNFSPEPGTITVGGKNLVNEWKGYRPMESSLRSFIDVITGKLHARDWPLLAKRHLPSIRLSEEATTQLKKLQGIRWKNSSLSEENPLDLELAIDLFLPDTAIEGKRHRVLELQEKKDFFRSVLMRDV